MNFTGLVRRGCGFAALFFGCGILFHAAHIGAGEKPVVKIEKVEAFSVIGIAVRTNNAKEMSGKGVIGDEWARFYREGVLEKIPDKVGADVYGVVTDYASDRNGDYTNIIGAKVKEGAKAPPGMVMVKVLPGKYTVVTSSRGSAAQVVPETWRQIWTLEDNGRLGGRRAYKTDFEFYDERSQDPKNSQVVIHVGIE